MRRYGPGMAQELTDTIRDTPLAALPAITRPARRGWLAVAALVLAVLSGVLGVVGYERLHRAALAEAGQRGQNTLSLAVAALDGQLRRFDRLPHLLAQQRVIRALVRAPLDPEAAQAANQYLAETAVLMQASDIYVMDMDGTTIAASNHDTPISFVGRNFDFRPYFQDALTRGEGRFYALGTTSRVRGYYFGVPILVGEAPAGVMVIKIDLDSIEESWRGSDYEVIVTDPEEIVFMATRPEWTFGATRPLTPERLAQTQATRRYADAGVTALALERAQGPAGAVLWRIDGAEYLVLSEAMPEADWTVQVLVNTQGARAAALTRLALAGLVAGFAVLASVVIWQRRERLRERLALQAQAQSQLERRVAERTAELAAVNAALAGEVAERTAAEARLRATQADLVQAGKLAALGQMSAALSHEFNQPLGAARNFAENAQTLIDRGRVDEAREAVGRILSLIGRMGELSKHLRNFARKPGSQLSDVPLPEAIDAVLDILGWRLKALDITLIRDIPPLVVRAGPVRLQQVLVNILSNAMDAVEGQEVRVITLRARDEGARVVITLADSGPGIAPQLKDRVFDPFFSTKGVGKGLGLGLSISYNIVRDFGGTLSVENAQGGGAVFTLSLDRVAA